MEQDTLIYEYRSTLFIIQRSQQGKAKRPGDGSGQRLSESSGLTASLPVGAVHEQIGAGVLKALDSFDRHPPSYDPWELKELRKQLCDWIGARGYPTLVKNSRLVLVLRDSEQGTLVVIPFDNHNLNPWETQLTDRQLVLPATASAREVGQAVETAFTYATYHPDRKDPR